MTGWRFEYIMTNNSDLSKHRVAIARKSLKALYDDMAAFGAEFDLSKKTLSEEEIEQRARFFRRMKGQFIRVFRVKKELSVQEVAEMMGWASSDLEHIEAGDYALPDPEFFRLCGLLEATTEVAVFLERMEEACTPGLKQARTDLADTLRTHGVVFADDDKYESQEKGRLLVFRKRTGKDENEPK